MRDIYFSRRWWFLHDSFLWFQMLAGVLYHIRCIIYEIYWFKLILLIHRQKFSLRNLVKTLKYDEALFCFLVEPNCRAFVNLVSCHGNTIQLYFYICFDLWIRNSRSITENTNIVSMTKPRNLGFTNLDTITVLWNCLCMDSGNDKHWYI